METKFRVRNTFKLSDGKEIKMIAMMSEDDHVPRGVGKQSTCNLTQTKSDKGSNGEYVAKPTIVVMATESLLLEPN